MTSKNNKILEILDIFLQYYIIKKDNIHITAYNKAIYGIKTYIYEITNDNINDILKIHGIGIKMKNIINIILKTDTHPNIPIMLSYISYMSNNNLSNLMGFGPSLIEILKLKYNIISLEEFSAYISIHPIPELTNMALLGWKYRFDLETLISRNETTSFFNKFKNLLIVNNELQKYKIEVQLAGSYPSGKLFSKDIDIIVFYKAKYNHSNTILTKYIMKLLIEELKNIDDTLEIVLNGNIKFLGLIKTGKQQIYRHIDIVLYHIDVKPYAILYFTSGKILNQIIREKAKKKGYKINEYGLFDKNTNKKIIIKEPIIDNIYKLLNI